MEELKGFIIKLETVGLQKRGFCVLILRNMPLHLHKTIRKK
ncbi:hypothetical protein VCRA217O17_30138 [Vibrio crassostreae]|nr:hypothetical protein VCRA217O17_30138 [Vibrio crassostreae]